MEKKITVLPGDGIGPEIVEEAKKVLSAVEERFGHTFSYEEGLVGAAAIDATGDPFPGDTLNKCLSGDAILFGAIGDPKYDNDPHAKVRPEQGLLRMRKSLGLFANVRPVKSYPILEDASPLRSDIISGANFTVFRELTGGIYFGEPRGRSEDGNKAFDTCVYSKEEIRRVASLAFDYARNKGGKLTLVDKANVLATSRLWREVVNEMAENEYPDVEYESMFVDNAAMKIITNPSHFDVIVTGNMFGDIITDESSVITGSLGMLPSASIGNENALFEPIHGSFPQAAGQNKANPLATILSASMLLENAFHLTEESEAIEKAVEQVLEEKYVTEDIKGGNKSTSDVGDKVAELVKTGEQVKA